MTEILILTIVVSMYLEGSLSSLKYTMTSSILFMLSVVLGIPLIIIGWIYGVVSNLINLKFTAAIRQVFKVIYRFISEIGWLVLKVAVGIDRLANLTAGDLLSKLLATSDSTYLGEGGITISGSLGHLKSINGLSLLGKKLCQVLNYLDSNHCEEAWTYYKNKL